jgi:hypothetical protein
MRKQQLRKLVPLLKVLIKLGSEDRTTVLSYLDSEAVDGLCECIYNCISNNNITNTNKAKLKKELGCKKHIYRYLVKKSNSIAKRKKLIKQTGTGIETVLSTVLPFLLALI